jgi:hypothetical protein
MRSNRRLSIRLTLLVSLLIALAITSSRLHTDTGTCGGVNFWITLTNANQLARF